MNHSCRISDQPLVSVVLSFRNGRNTLPYALNSILWQTHRNWELILINDGSTDGAELLARTFQDSRIRFYSHSTSQGLPACLNQGVSLARGIYIARMDADDIAFPERFARQVDYLQNHPDVHLVATAALLIDNHNQAIGVLAAAQTHEEISCRPWHGFSMPHPTWMGRSEWFRRYPYDEHALKGQDQALLFRTYLSSRFAGLPEALLGYRYEGLSLRKTILGRFHYLHGVASYGAFGLLLKGIFGHVLAAIRDIAAILFGLEAQVIKKRVCSCDSRTLAEWQSLMERMLELIEKKGNL